MAIKFERLQNHLVRCGYGQVGAAVANALKQQKVESVVVERIGENAAEP